MLFSKVVAGSLLDSRRVSIGQYYGAYWAVAMSLLGSSRVFTGQYYAVLDLSQLGSIRMSTG